MADKIENTLLIRKLMDELTNAIIAQRGLAQTAIENDDIKLSIEAMASNIDHILRIWRAVTLELTPQPAREELISFYDSEKTKARVAIMEMHRNMVGDISDLVLFTDDQPSED